MIQTQKTSLERQAALRARRYAANDISLPECGLNFEFPRGGVAALTLFNQIAWMRLAIHQRDHLGLVEFGKGFGLAMGVQGGNVCPPFA